MPTDRYFRAAQSDNAMHWGGGPAVEAHFQFSMWLIPSVEKFPGALGQRPIAQNKRGSLSATPCLTSVHHDYLRDNKRTIKMATPEIASPAR